MLIQVTFLHPNVRCWLPAITESEQIFISTSSKKQTPFILNIGCFLALSATCLSCPLRTYLRSNTKLYTVKVSPASLTSLTWPDLANPQVKKLYYYDPKKPSPVPSVVGQSVDLPPENVDCAESANNLPSFLPSRAFSIEVENLSFRKVSDLSDTLYWNITHIFHHSSTTISTNLAPVSQTPTETQLIRWGNKVSKYTFLNMLYWISQASSLQKQMSTSNSNLVTSSAAVGGGEQRLEGQRVNNTTSCWDKYGEIWGSSHEGYGKT